jgi:hypothetical protein
MAASNFQPYLQPSERLLWSGRPQPGLMLQKADHILIPFSLIWVGFTSYLVWARLPGSADIGLWITLMLMLVVGSYLLIGRFFHDAHIRSHITYGVTDRRILFLRQRRAAAFMALDIKALTALKLKLGKNNRGTIIFSKEKLWIKRRNFEDSNVDFGPWPRFLGVENAKTIYELIERQKLQ